MGKRRKSKLKLSAHSHKRDTSGRIIVNMTVKDDSDFLSVFSGSDTPVISSGVAEFIESSTYSILPKEQLSLRIYSDCVDDNEKEEYQKAIKAYYSERYILNKQELKRNVIISLLLVLSGLITLTLSFLIDNQTGSLFWTEVVNIVAWVFIWEAVHVSAFRNRALRIKMLRYLSYLSMNIEFFTVKDITKQD